MLQRATGMWYGWGEIDGKKITPRDWWNLKISIHGGFESVFWNYQQLIKGEIGFSSSGFLINKHRDNFSDKEWMPLYSKGLRSRRSPVYQQELFNGHLFIFIKAENEKGRRLLDKIKESLRNPQKILYLGRSEDVVFIKDVLTDDDIIIESGIAKKNLWFQYPTYLDYKIRYSILHQRYPVYSIPTQVIFRNSEKEIEYKSEITKETKRDVIFKTVLHIRENHIIKLKKEHEGVEYEEYHIKGKIFYIPKECGWL